MYDPRVAAEGIYHRPLRNGAGYGHGSLEAVTGGYQLGPAWPRSRGVVGGHQEQRLSVPTVRSRRRRRPARWAAIPWTLSSGAIFAGARPDRLTRLARVRPRSARAASSSGDDVASESRYVVTTSSRQRSSSMARNRSSCSEGRVHQWGSSRMTTTRSRAARARRDRVPSRDRHHGSRHFRLGRVGYVPDIRVRWPPGRPQAQGPR